MTVVAAVSARSVCRGSLLTVLLASTVVSGCGGDLDQADGAARPPAASRTVTTPTPTPTSGGSAIAEPSRSGPREPPPEPGPNATGRPPVTLAFAGDIHFQQALADLVDDPTSTLGPMSADLEKADLAMVNLESALATGGEPAAKELEDPADRYWFRSPPATLDLLERSGVDVVNLANNHGADYGARGLRESLRADRRSPVAVVGLGADPAEAYRPHRVTLSGTTVAVLAADTTQAESNDAIWDVGPDGPGLASARGSATGRLLKAVRGSARTSDVVVVYLHWGEEKRVCPTDEQQSLAKALSEAGADVVVGSHTHEVMGSGMLGDTYVGYGLGNFLWYHGIQSETGVLTVRIEDGVVVGDAWAPARISAQGGQPQRLGGQGRRQAITDWRRLRGCTNLDPVPGQESRSNAEEDALPAPVSAVRRLDPELRRRMTSSFDPATCPVRWADLRHLRVSYVDFEGRARIGELVVAADVAADVTAVFAELYAARWPIRRMELVDRYEADDDRSMAANNTSAYNCRTVAGSDTWSAHAYGRAIDINPVQNPYVTGSGTSPPAGRQYAMIERRPASPVPAGVIKADDVVVEAFARVGWTWGGTWSQPDYQHFSAP